MGNEYCKIHFLEKNEMYDLCDNGMIEPGSHYITYRKNDYYKAFTNKAKKKGIKHIILLVFVAAIVLIIGTVTHYFSYNGLLDFAYSFSVSYVVTAVFYYVTVYKPEMDAKKIAFPIIRYYVLSIADEMEDIIKEFVESSDVVFDNEINVELINKIKK